MRHQNTKAKLNRTASHRNALMMNLTRALIEHKKITTTLPKAKALRSYAEKIITHAKVDDVAHRRQVLKKLRSRDAVHTLFHEIGPRFRDRNGGYTRIIKLENRGGDNAPMAILELVGFSVDEPVKTSRRRRRTTQQTRKPAAGKASAPVQEAEETVAEETAAEAVEDTATVEETAAADTTEDIQEAEATVDEAPAETEVADEPVEEPKAAEADAPAEDAPAEDAEPSDEPEAKADDAGAEDEKSENADDSGDEEKKD